MVALDQCVRSDSVVTLTIRPFPYRNGTPFAPAVLKVLRSSKYSLLTSRTRRSALAPFRLSILFLFRGGGFFKIEWAETGLGRASSKEGAVGMKSKFNIEPRVIFIASGSSNALESILGIRLGHFR